MNRQAYIRWSLLGIWLLSAAITVAVFAERMFGHRQWPMRYDEISASFKTVMAFYGPTIGMMLSYLFSMPEDAHREIFPVIEARVILGLSVLYHVCFIAIVIMGISLNEFDQSLPAGQGFAANTSTVASLLGGISILLIPINILFLKSNSKSDKAGTS